MRVWSLLQSLFTPKPRHAVFAPTPKIILTQSCLDAVQTALEPEKRKGHEGVVYLLGRTDGVITLATTVFRPVAITTQGSFSVDPIAMARCVEAAASYELQVVGQLHTHPGEAYHSDGDVEGARIRYPGFASIVIPDYGRSLPDLSRAAVYMWGADGDWRRLTAHDVLIIPGAGPWIGSNGMTGATTGRSVTRRVV